jgi:hypothetical protein
MDQTEWTTYLTVGERINIPYHCTPTSEMQEAQKDTCIKHSQISKVWYKPSFVFNYVNLGLQILQQADNTLSRLGYGSDKLNNFITDEQLTTLYPNRFPKDNVLAAEEQFNIYQNKKIPKEPLKNPLKSIQIQD